MGLACSTSCSLPSILPPMSPWKATSASSLLPPAVESQKRTQKPRLSALTQSLPARALQSASVTDTPVSMSLSRASGVALAAASIATAKTNERTAARVRIFTRLMWVLGGLGLVFCRDLFAPACRLPDAPGLNGRERVGTARRGPAD